MTTVRLATAARISSAGAVLVAAVFAVAAAAGPTMPGCSYEYGGLSVTYMAQDGSPVLFQMFTCGGRFVKRYIDFAGAELKESDLLPSVRHTMIDYLEDRLGVDITDPTDDMLEDLAIERGLI